MRNQKAEFEGLLAGMPESVKRHGRAFVAANKIRPNLRDLIPDLTNEDGRSIVPLALLLAGGVGGVGGALALAHVLSQPEAGGQAPGGTIGSSGAVIYQLESSPAFVSQGTVGGGVVDVLTCQNLTSGQRMFEVQAENGPRGWMGDDAIEENEPARQLCSGPARDIPVSDEAAVVKLTPAFRPTMKPPEDGWWLAFQGGKQSTALGAAATAEATEVLSEVLSPGEFSPLDCRDVDVARNWQKCYRRIIDRLSPLLNEEWGQFKTASDTYSGYWAEHPETQVTVYQNVAYLGVFKFYWNRPDGWTTDSQRPDYVFVFGLNIPGKGKIILPAMPFDAYAAGRNAIGVKVNYYSPAKDIIGNLRPGEILPQIYVQHSWWIEDKVANFILSQEDIYSNDRMLPLHLFNDIESKSAT